MSLMWMLPDGKSFILPWEMLETVMAVIMVHGLIQFLKKGWVDYQINGIKMVHGQSRLGENQSRIQSNRCQACPQGW